MEQQTVTLIVGLGGVIVGGLITWATNLFTNQQRFKHELDMLEKRLQHEERDRSVKIKLEKVERAYVLLIEMNNTLRQTTRVISPKSKENTVGLSDMVLRLDAQIDNLLLISDLYIPDITGNVERIASIFIDIKNKIRNVSILKFDDAIISWNSHQFFANNLWKYVRETQDLLKKTVDDQNLLYSVSDPPTKP